ncbi:hypothetical protein FRC02_004164 [Tulasnella sp. 418]|nr:hypothetical protein FRC02_004164 [Tulasnella sp. 418]
MEFVRRICNFARFARPEGPEELSDPNYQEKVDLVQSIFDDFQTEKAKYSHQSRRKGNQGDHRTSRAGEQDMTRLTQKGFNMIQIPYEMYQVIIIVSNISNSTLISTGSERQGSPSA